MLEEEDGWLALGVGQRGRLVQFFEAEGAGLEEAPAEGLFGEGVDSEDGAGIIGAGNFEAATGAGEEDFVGKRIVIKGAVSGIGPDMDAERLAEERQASNGRALAKIHLEEIGEVTGGLLNFRGSGAREPDGLVAMRQFSRRGHGETGEGEGGNEEERGGFHS